MVLCPHFDRCSGCSLDLKQEPNVLNFNGYKDVAQFFESKGIPNIKLHAGNPTHWRTRAKLAVQNRGGEVQIGMFEGRSHALLEIPECKVHHPLINETVERLKRFLNETGISAYDEKTGKGLLRYVQLTVQRRSSERPSEAKLQLALVLNQEPSITADLQSALNAFWIQHSSSLHSIWVNFNTRRDNVIFGDLWALVKGELWLWETFCDREIAFHPASFMQANPEMFERLLIELKKWVPQAAVITEFYAGGGTIGLTLIEKAGRIHFNEIVPLSETCFEASCSKLPSEKVQKLSFTCGSAESSEILTHQPNLVIVDPPRKGVDPALLEKILSATSVKRLIYVSCGFKSFKRDAEFLLQSGFGLSHAETFWFFPGTEQFEILAVFDREESPYPST